MKNHRTDRFFNIRPCRSACVWTSIREETFYEAPGVVRDTAFAVGGSGARSSQGDGTDERAEDAAGSGEGPGDLLLTRETVADELQPGAGGVMHGNRAHLRNAITVVRHQA